MSSFLSSVTQLVCQAVSCLNWVMKMKSMLRNVVVAMVLLYAVSHANPLQQVDSLPETDLDAQDIEVLDNEPSTIGQNQNGLSQPANVQQPQTMEEDEVKAPYETQQNNVVLTENSSTVDAINKVEQLQEVLAEAKRLTKQYQAGVSDLNIINPGKQERLPNIFPDGLDPSVNQRVSLGENRGEIAGSEVLLDKDFKNIDQLEQDRDTGFPVLDQQEQLPTDGQAVLSPSEGKNEDTADAGLRSELPGAENVKPDARQLVNEIENETMEQLQDSNTSLTLDAEVDEVIATEAKNQSMQKPESQLESNPSERNQSAGNENIKDDTGENVVEVMDADKTANVSQEENETLDKKKAIDNDLSNQKIENETNQTEQLLAAEKEEQPIDTDVNEPSSLNELPGREEVNAKTTTQQMPRASEEGLIDADETEIVAEENQSNGDDDADEMDLYPDDAHSNEQDVLRKDDDVVENYVAADEFEQIVEDDALNKAEDTIFDDVDSVSEDNEEAIEDEIEREREEDEEYNEDENDEDEALLEPDQFDDEVILGPKSQAEIIYVEESEGSFRYVILLMMAVAIVGFCYCGGWRSVKVMLLKATRAGGYGQGFAGRDGYLLLPQSSKRA